MKTSPGRLAVAFAMVIGAGLSTALGAAAVFITDRLNKKLLAAALAGSTGVMLYVSFVEIFSVKAIGAFQEAGHDLDKATIFATLCFFGGMFVTWVLDKFVHVILHGLEKRKKRNQQLMTICVSHVNHECDHHPTHGQDQDESDESDVVTRALVNVARRSAAARKLDQDESDESGKLNVMGCGCPALDSAADPKASEDQSVVVGERTMDLLQRPEGNPALHDPATGAPLPAVRGHEAELTHEINRELRHAISPTRAHPEVSLPGSEPPSSQTAEPLLPPQDQAQANAVQPLEIDPDLADDHHAGLAKVGLLTAIALFIHNGPEGLATFIAAVSDFKAGAALAFAVLLHNIPEGMCVSFPVYYATGSKWKGLTWGVLSAVSEPLGGLVGLAIIESGLSPVAYGVLFGIVAGMMVFISLVEVYPSAVKFDPSQKVVMPCMVAGMAVIALSLLMFKF